MSGPNHRQAPAHIVDGAFVEGEMRPLKRAAPDRNRIREAVRLHYSVLAPFSMFA
jgi:hypothetical protein